MKIIVAKQAVNYGVNGSNVAITDIANVDTLATGSFLFTFDNGNIVKQDGTITTASSAKPAYGIIYYNDGSGIAASHMIPLSSAKLVTPLPDNAPAKKVSTFDLTVTATSELTDTGIIVYDPSVIMQENRYKYITKGLSTGFSQSSFNAYVLAAVKELPYVYSASVDGNDVLTVTYKDGKNPYIKGVGFLKGVTETVTTPMSLGDSLSGAELSAYIHKEISPFEGNRENYIDGNMGMFTKEYLVNTALRYVVFGITWTPEANGRPYANSPAMPNEVIIALVEGQAAATNENYLDILKAFTTGTGNDSGAAGADAADN